MTDIQAIPIAPARQIARLASPADFFAVYNKKKKLAFGAVGRAVEKPPTPQQSTSTSPPRASSPVHSTSTTKSKLSATAAPFIMPNASITSAVTNATVQETKAKVNASRSILVAGTTGTWPQYGVEYEDENMATINDEQQVELDFDDRVSEAGLEGLPRQHVRATEGNDVTNELLDWDGKRWAPVPASWEYDRAAFDGGFLPNYIREWVQTVPAGKRVTVNINNPLFANGKAPIDNDVLIFPTYQPITTPCRFIFALHLKLPLTWTRLEVGYRFRSRHQARELRGCCTHCAKACQGEDGKQEVRRGVQEATRR